MVIWAEADATVATLGCAGDAPCLKARSSYLARLENPDDVDVFVLKALQILIPIGKGPVCVQVDVQRTAGRPGKTEVDAERVASSYSCRRREIISPEEVPCSRGVPQTDPRVGLSRRNADPLDVRIVRHGTA